VNVFLGHSVVYGLFVVSDGKQKQKDAQNVFEIAKMSAIL